MNATDFCIYGYLSVLAVGCVIYGIIVVAYGGEHQQPLRVDIGLPLDILQNETILNDLYQLENITNGLSVNIWWGEVEYDPQQYDWSMYQALFNTVQTTMPKARARVTLNFHACYDTSICTTPISLPAWINSTVQDPNVFYTDVNGYTTYEYLTSGVDHINIFPPSNRTAVEMYVDFVQSFADTFKDMFDDFIYEVQIGLGPNGELRYPAFPSSKWKLPGVGQFQSYDSYLQNEYMTYANKTRPEFGFMPSASAVNYTNTPAEAPFFYNEKSNGSSSDYGQFYLSWYSSRLLQHGNVILSQMYSILRTYSPNVTVAAQIGCIYWQNGDSSRAAEVTAGYMNYTIITEMLQNANVRMVFGCFDLEDRAAEAGLVGAHAAPQQLVNEMLSTSKTIGLRVVGTNSLPYDTNKLAVIVDSVKHNPVPIVGFTYNYLSYDMVANLKDFRHFVDQLNATTSKK